MALLLAEGRVELPAGPARPRPDAAPRRSARARPTAVTAHPLRPRARRRRASAGSGPRRPGVVPRERDRGQPTVLLGSRRVVEAGEGGVQAAHPILIADPRQPVRPGARAGG